MKEKNHVSEDEGKNMGGLAPSPEVNKEGNMEEYKMHHKEHKGGAYKNHEKHEETQNHEGHKNHQNHHQMMVKDFRKRFFVSAILTIPVLLLSPLIQDFFRFSLAFPGDVYVLFALSSIIYLYGGYPFLKGIATDLKKKQPGMMTLIAVAISVAYIYSTAVVFVIPGKFFFWELSTLIDIMLLGHWIEMRSILGASRALEALVKLMPAEAHLMKEDGTVVDVPTAKLRPGDIVLVKPGEKIPSDGVILKGATNVNEAMLTGESQPIFKKAGDEVIGGSINGEGAIEVKITHTGEETYLSQVIKLVKEAQQTRSRTQDLANRAAFYLTIIAILGGTLTFVIWLLLGKDVAFALERMVTVMVITCPYALGLAVPLVVSVSTSISARNGLLIRNRTAFENARKLDAIVFDKTGTLTEGKFGVTDVVTENGFTEDDVIRYAYALEANSEHPIAQGITALAKERGLEKLEVKEFKAIPGKGVIGKVNGKTVMVAGPGYLRENNIQIENEEIEKLQSQGKTTVFILLDNKVIGAIALADIIRPESEEAIKRLQEMGIKCMMLTGDNKLVAKWVAEKLGLDNYFAEVLPHEKSQVIRKIQSEGFTVAMVGDGINDAPALVQADVGIAIGAGTDVAIESADIILVRNDPRDVTSIIKLAKATYRKMKQNLMWATAYNAVAIPLAAGILYNIGILLSPAAGAILMSLSTVIVAINARLLSL